MNHIVQLRKDRKQLDRSIDLAKSSSKQVKEEIRLLTKRRDYFSQRLERKYAERNRCDELLKVYRSQKTENVEHARRKLEEDIEAEKLKWAFSKKDVGIQEGRLRKMNDYLTRHGKAYDELQEKIIEAKHNASADVSTLEAQLLTLHEKLLSEEEEKKRVLRDLELTRQQEQGLKRSLDAKRQALETLFRQ